MTKDELSDLNFIKSQIVISIFFDELFGEPFGELLLFPKAHAE